tara:strand:+ start:77 stop:229 length:153 start_codon:yes stop_codon:yes gene_type:complete
MEKRLKQEIELQTFYPTPKSKNNSIKKNNNKKNFSIKTTFTGILKQPLIT